VAERIKVLIIDDEAAIRRFLRASLDPRSYEVVDAENGEQGIRLVATQNPDVVLLDLGLPDLDGVDVTRNLREWTRVPIIVLSARMQEEDKVAALDAGADDYLTKPFGLGELLARIRVAVRHAREVAGESSDPVMEAFGVKVEQSSRQVWKNGEEVHLTPIEYKLLSVMIAHSGKVVTHRQLLERVWGPQYVDENHYLRVYMGQLRHKLEDSPAQPKLLTTEPGVGYRLRTD
jgi:two-component system KDP operon response regulator KdpE